MLQLHKDPNSTAHNKPEDLPQELSSHRSLHEGRGHQQSNRVPNRMGLLLSTKDQAKQHRHRLLCMPPLLRGESVRLLYSQEEVLYLMHSNRIYSECMYQLLLHQLTHLQDLQQPLLKDTRTKSKGMAHRLQ